MYTIYYCCGYPVYTVCSRAERTEPRRPAASPILWFCRREPSGDDGEPHDFLALDGPAFEPCWACGKKPSHYRERRGTRQLCTRCYGVAVRREQRAGPPLPNAIDPKALRRVSASVGRCGVCGLEKAVWSGQGVRLCEMCHQRESRRAVEAGAEVAAGGAVRTKPSRDTVTEKRRQWPTGSYGRDTPADSWRRRIGSFGTIPVIDAICDGATPFFPVIDARMIAVTVSRPFGKYRQFARDSSTRLINSLCLAVMPGKLIYLLLCITLRICPGI